MNVGIDQQELSNLIGAIYDCAIDPGQWPATLQRLAGALGGCNGTLLNQSMETASFAYQWGTPQKWLDAYATTFVRINPLLTMGWHFEPDDPISVRRVMSTQAVRRTQFYREFLQPLGWLDFLAIILQRSATTVTVASFTRYEADGPPTVTQVNLLRLLAPHLRRAVIFHGVHQKISDRTEALSAALDALAVPIMLLDREGRCVRANQAAEHFLSVSDAVRSEAGLLRARDPTIAAEWASALTTTTPATRMSFALTQADGRRFAAHVMPLTGALRARIAGGSNAAAALFIQPVGEHQPLPGEVLVKLYGLTPAETRLLALLGQDLSLDETAATLGITMPTARSHLQRIFQKTNTNRQSQLVRLVLSALPRPPS
ncbi:MAG: helix-turn-helix transcriptional regulator [Acetobacteraceae bacterium]